jgi:hypothetical protein
LKKAYIIAAHKYPEHLCRLIERLDDGQATFYIHIDKKADINQFNCLNKFGEKIIYVDRVVSRWATMGQVQSTLNAMKAIVASGEPYEMISFLSGQDYPIKTNEEIDSFFRSSDKSIFLDYFSIPDYEKWEKGGGMWRMDKYFLGMERYNLILSKTLNSISTFLPFLRRKVPDGMKMYLGSAWFSMDLDAIKYILKYMDENPKYRAFQKYSFSPDESIYIMILVNSPEQSIVKRISNDYKRLIKWKNWSTANPEILKVKDFDEIYQSKALFARKFDPLVDSKIIDMIDEKILGL